MKILPFLLSIALCAQAAQPTKAEDITYDLLVQMGKKGYCDAVPHIQKISENYPVKTMLEFGLGYSTKYFLDSFTKVLSVEYVTNALPATWIKYCIDLYQNYSNWLPIAFFSDYSGDISWAPYRYLATSKLSDAEMKYSIQFQDISDHPFIKETKTFIGNISKYHKYDLALIDPPSLLRGPLVELLFDKVPIILAQDAFSFFNDQIPDIYGYRRVSTPENYECIFLPQEKGTLLWIQKNDATDALIQTMKEYAQLAMEEFALSP